MSLVTAFVTAALLAATVGKPSDFVVMQFTAPWCEPCKEMAPSLESLADKGWIIRSVDVEKEKSIVQRWKVTHLPTLIVLKNGTEIDRITGVHSLRELTQKLPSVSSAKTTLASTGPAPFPMLESGSQSPTKQEPIKPFASGTNLDRVNPSSPNSLPNTSETKTSAGSLAADQFSQSTTDTIIDPMSTTVRIKIEDANHMSYGTGTMIDQVHGEVLVLTCGHLFRDLSSTSRMIVEAPINGQLAQIPATVVDYRCDDTDIGLISFKTDMPVLVAKLFPRGTKLQEGETVASFGCDGGADPTRRDSHITKLNRYLGPANVEVAKAPVQGRSGGGLFNTNGQLIGVCYAADNELDEGLFSGPEVVYTQLKRLGLTRLYTQSTPAPQVAQNTPAPNLFPDQINRASSIRETGNDDWRRDVQQASDVARRSAAVIASASASMKSNPVATSSVTAIIRDEQGRERTISIPNPSVALLQLIESNQSVGSRNLASQASNDLR